ncbi:MAG: MaoC family dehydratase [Clostridiales Family XIII bacterium]|jgi:3-hydroxybutyryl-CoA dehydratase|nr:MaoC family dehydratase [Clostridiales Family XIII bacterium]
MYYDDLNVGDSASFEKTITETDVYGFAGITGDFNPAHINQRYAEGTKFGTRIAHGMLSGSLFSTIFGTELPGKGTIYLSQTLSFVAPVLIGDTVKATVRVSEKLGKGRVRFDCTAAKQDGTVVVQGEALLLPPRP